MDVSDGIIKPIFHGQLGVQLSDVKILTVIDGIDSCQCQRRR